MDWKRGPIDDGSQEQRIHTPSRGLVHIHCLLQTRQPWYNNMAIVVVCVFGYGCNGSGIPNKPHDFVLALGRWVMDTGNVRQKGAQIEWSLAVDMYPYLLSCLVICVSMCDWKGCIMYASKYVCMCACVSQQHTFSVRACFTFCPLPVFSLSLFSRHHPPPNPTTCT